MRKLIVVLAVALVPCVAFAASASKASATLKLLDSDTADESTDSSAMARAKIKRTMADIRTLATAIEARATDTNEYPSVKTLDELDKLLSPTYVLNMPRVDGWGHEFVYIGDRDHYRIASAGADGKFTEASGKSSVKSGFGDDIVYENGAFLAPTSNPD
jgi:hypothetical protein